MEPAPDEGLRGLLGVLGPGQGQGGHGQVPSHSEPRGPALQGAFQLPNPSPSGVGPRHAEAAVCRASRRGVRGRRRPRLPGPSGLLGAPGGSRGLGWCVCHARSLLASLQPTSQPQGPQGGRARRVLSGRRVQGALLGAHHPGLTAPSPVPWPLAPGTPGEGAPMGESPGGNSLRPPTASEAPPGIPGEEAARQPPGPALGPEGLRPRPQRADPGARLRHLGGPHATPSTWRRGLQPWAQQLRGRPRPTRRPRGQGLRKRSGWWRPSRRVAAQPDGQSQSSGSRSEFRAGGAALCLQKPGVGAGWTVPLSPRPWAAPSHPCSRPPACRPPTVTQRSRYSAPCLLVAVCSSLFRSLTSLLCCGRVTLPRGVRGVRTLETLPPDRDPEHGDAVTSRAGPVLTLVPPDLGTVPGDTCPVPLCSSSRPKDLVSLTL